MTCIAVNCSVLCEEPSQVAAAMEALGRVGAGIALDGMSVQVSIVTVPDEESE